MFQLRLERELFDIIAKDPEFIAKYEQLVLRLTRIASRKQIIVTFSGQIPSDEVLRFFGRFGPVVKRDYADDVDPVHAGRYRRSESEL